MGILDRIRGRTAKATSTDRAGWFVEWAQGGQPNASGLPVSPDTAMRLSAVWACVRVRSEDIGKLPCFLYRRLPDGGKERATDHPLYALVHDRPNPRMTAFEFRQVMQANLDLRGNAYAYKEFDARGRVTALWPINPAHVTVLRTSDGRELFYRIASGDKTETLPGEMVMHLRGMSLDGVVGLSPIAYHRETIGMALAAQKYGAAFYGNNAQPLGALKVPQPISSEAAQKLRESWKARHLGKRELAIFDGGMEWVQTGLTNDDAQYIETLQFQNAEIWRIYRMPPHKVADLSKATFSNIEQQALEYVTDCLGSELVRWEQTLIRDLLLEEDRAEYFVEFLVEGLLRGDIKSRYEAYAVARNWGWLSVNDIRERENLNKVPDGDIYLQPLNMIEAGKDPPEPAAPPPPPEPVSASDAAKAVLEAIRAVPAPVINVTTPELRVAPPDVTTNLTLAMPAGRKTITARRNESGDLVAHVTEETA